MTLNINNLKADNTHLKSRSNSKRDKKTDSNAKIKEESDELRTETDS